MGTVCVDTQKRVTHLKKYARAVNEWRGLSGSQRPEKIYRRLRRAQSGAHYGLKIERVTCMPEMTVTVSMTAEEFQEFMEWRRDLSLIHISEPRLPVIKKATCAWC